MSKNRIGNEHIQEDLGLTSTCNKLREIGFKWFGHIQYWLTMTLERQRGHDRKQKDKFK